MVGSVKIGRFREIGGCWPGHRRDACRRAAGAGRAAAGGRPGRARAWFAAEGAGLCNLEGYKGYTPTLLR